MTEWKKIKRKNNDKSTQFPKHINISYDYEIDFVLHQSSAIYLFTIVDTNTYDRVLQFFLSLLFFCLPFIFHCFIKKHTHAHTY